jgi:hypothetical protein
MAAVFDPTTSGPARVAFSILTVVGICSPQVDAQQAVVQAPPSHIVIPFLANATRPADLEFEGGECEIDKTGNTMECEFQQIFLTTSAVAPQTCLITTNRYERTFQKQTSTRWVSNEGPAGVCAVVDVATLQDDGGVKWTMETRKVITRRDASPQCQGLDEQRETLSWQNVRRALPCTFVQPGGLGR